MSQHVRCSRRHCGATMVEVRLVLGRIGFECPLCAINKKGRCRTPRCRGRLSHAKAMYCGACARARLKKSNNAAQLRRYHNNPAVRERQAALLAKRMKDPAYHAARLEYKRDYDKRNPWNALNRLYDRTYRAEHPLTAAQKKRANERARRRYQQNADVRETHVKRNRDRRAARAQAAA